MTKLISRRTVLKGIGAGIALPWLEAMGPFKAWGSQAAGGNRVPTRMAFVYVPNGKNMAEWTPTADGADFTLPRTLEPLAGVKDYLNVLTGLTADKARPNGDGGGDHARAMSAFLTGAQPRKTDGSDIRVGVSFDQVAATRLSDRERASPRSKSAAIRARWRATATRAIAAFIPRPSPGAPRRRRCRSSTIRASSSTVCSRPAPTPTALAASAIAAAFSISSAKTPTACSRTSAPAINVGSTNTSARSATSSNGSNAPRCPGHRARTWLSRLASQTIIKSTSACSPICWSSPFRPTSRACARSSWPTRGATSRTRSSTSAKAITTCRITKTMPPSSPRRSSAASTASTRRSSPTCSNKLKATRDGSGNLLDHAMIVCSSGNSDGNRHNHEDLPIIVAGKGERHDLHAGRHIKVPREDAPLNNLWVSMLDRMDVRGVERLGDSTGKAIGIELN